LISQGKGVNHWNYQFWSGLEKPPTTLVISHSPLRALHR